MLGLEEVTYSDSSTEVKEKNGITAQVTQQAKNWQLWLSSLGQ